MNEGQLLVLGADEFSFDGAARESKNAHLAYKRSRKHLTELVSRPPTPTRTCQAVGVRGIFNLLSRGGSEISDWSSQSCFTWSHVVIEQKLVFSIRTRSTESYELEQLDLCPQRETEVKKTKQIYN